ncbi:alpha/beta hydrolase family protein [Novosphingobium subterraneum]|uniref:alpha/beta hydrolase family protein n=1 Tax=Novosphingobium subterraneum TaxID=48936 RepID=UPI003D06E646
MPARTAGSVKAGAMIALAVMLLAIAGLFVASRVQSTGGVMVSEVRFKGGSGAQMRALLFRPEGVTEAKPAPAILAFHGYLNSAEMQGNFATEYARRGYVVLAPDQRGHGGSDPVTFADGFGGPDALAYLRSLPFVDRDNIGLEGHSMGGWAVLRAAEAHRDGYRSLVLEGSSVGSPFAPEGTTAFPRNLLVVHGTRDEFGGFMWGPEAPLATGAVGKLRTLFGSAEPVVPGRLYGRVEDGSARMLLTPGVTHAWLHQSSAGITPAIEWFGRTLKGARALPAGDQVWPWREAGDLLALLAIPALIAGALMAVSGWIGARGAMADDGATRAVSGRRGLELAAIAIVPALLFIPACMLVEVALGQNGLFRQTFTNQFAGWALVSAGLSILALKRKGAGLPLGEAPRALAIAVLALLPAYILVLATDRMLHVNPSWWFITVRPVTIERGRDFLLYAPFFTLNCLASLCLIQSVSPLQNGSMASAMARAVATTAGGFVLFLLAQYGVLALTGHLLLAGEGLRVISAIGFAVFLAFVGIFGTVSRRMLGSVVPGALVSGLFVTWVLVATQPIGA